ncbi:hypothetical protein R6Q59_035887 [Mikania micrantha]
MHECGYIVRNNCSFQFKDWRLVPNEVRLPLRNKLTTLFDIDMENSNICKVVDSYMARAWRAHRAKLRAHFKENGGSKDLTKIKASPPYNISKEDWEYLCDMWCDAKFLEIAKKKVEARQNRKTESRNGSKSTIRYHLEHRHDLYSSSGQIDTWRLTHWEEKKGWISKDAAAAYEDMIKLRKQHSVESMSDKLILEKVLGRSSVRLHGWGRDPTVGSNTTGANQKLNQVTYNELVDEVETLKETCAIMQQILIEKNLMSPLPGSSQDDTSESDENVDE